MLENSKTQKSHKGNPLSTTGCGDATPTILLSALIHLDMQPVKSTRGGQLDVGSVMKGKGLYLANRGNDNLTSSYIDIKTHLFPS